MLVPFAYELTVSELTYLSQAILGEYMTTFNSSPFLINFPSFEVMVIAPARVRIVCGKDEMVRFIEYGPCELLSPVGTE